MLTHEEPLLNPADAEKYKTLGPAYFAARCVVEQAVAPFTADMMQSVVKEIADKLYTQLQDIIEDALWSDAELNLQGKMWRMVDETVQALLSGEKWAVERYCLGSRYDHDKVRAAIARHIPEELQNVRIADLEQEVADLKKSLEWERRR